MSLYYYTVGVLKLEQLNEGLINLTDIDIMLISILVIFIVGLIILGSSFKKLVDMIDKMEALEKIFKTDHRKIQF